MTLAQIATTIRNNVVDGLNGVSSLSFSLEQIEAEAMLTTASSIAKLAAQGLIDVNTLAQRVDGIRIECKDLSVNCNVPSEISAPHFQIPNPNRAIPNAISFLGSVDSSLSFKVYYDRDYRFHKYRLATARMPFAWVSSIAAKNGLYDVYLFNMGKYDNLQFVSLEILFDNPYDMVKTDYYSQFNTSEFYAPSYIQREVIDQLTQQYVNYYRQMHMKQLPNTQT